MDADEIIKLGTSVSGGKLFDDKGRTEIVQIFIWHDESRIHGIRFQYFENEKLVLGEMHGSTSAWAFDLIQLNYPSEYVTSIGGHYYVSSYGAYITELEICTNKLRYGSFGCNEDPYPRTADQTFQLRTGKGRQFYGFHGAVAEDGEDGLVSLGVYLKPATTLSAFVDDNGEGSKSFDRDSD